MRGFEIIFDRPITTECNLSELLGKQEKEQCAEAFKQYLLDNWDDYVQISKSEHHKNACWCSINLDWI